MDDENKASSSQMKIAFLLNSKESDTGKSETSRSSSTKDPNTHEAKNKSNEGEIKIEDEEKENISGTVSSAIQRSTADPNSNESESISEDIVIENNNLTLAEDVNSSSNHISIPSLHLQSSSQTISHQTTSNKTMSDELVPSKAESDVQNDESSKLDIVYVEENDNLESKNSESFKDSLNVVSGTSLDDFNLQDSLESSLLKSKMHQNSSVSQESNLILLSENADISGSADQVDSGKNEMIESAADPPLQLNPESNEDNDGGNGDSLSEDIIKLDIRGQASVPKPFQYFSKVFVNYENLNPTDVKYLNFDSNVTTNVVNQSPTKSLYFYQKENDKEKNIESPHASQTVLKENKEEDYEQDFAIEEIILNQSREMFPSKEELAEKQEPECSMSTVTTDYKTLCEDFHTKLSDVQSLVVQKDNIIDDLRLSLQEAAKYKDDLQIKNEELVSQISSYQKLLSEHPFHEDLPKDQQLSDFIKNEQFVQGDEYVKSETDGNKLKSDIHIDSEQLPNLNSEYLANLKVSEDQETLTLSVIRILMDKLDDEIQKINESIIKSHDSKDEGSVKAFTLSEVFSSIKPDNPHLLNTLSNIENKHKNEIEKLRTYFEDRCRQMEKQYSEEILHSKKASPDSSLDSLDNCPEALPFGSPLHGGGDKALPLFPNKITRSHSAEFHMENDKITMLQEKINELEKDHQMQIKNLIVKNDIRMNELKASYEEHISEINDEYKNQILDLKAHIQTIQSTEHDNGILNEQRKADKDLEEALTLNAKFDISSWPKEFITFKEKCEMEMQQTIDQLKLSHGIELTAMQDEHKRQMEIMNDKSKLEVDKWKQKRNDAFDKNRNLEETIKERDGLRQMTHTLQKVLSYLVKHFNMCEDELNNTFVGELFKFLDDDDLDNTLLLGSFTSGRNHETQLSTSLNVSRDNIMEISTVSTKRVHIAPKFNEIMPFIETDSILDCLDKTQDISVNFKQELDTCLMRLHDEAQELLLLSQAPKRKSILGANEEHKLTKDHASTDELLQEYDTLQNQHEKSQKEKELLEKALEESAYRESSLKDELQGLYEKISLYNSTPNPDSNECYSPPSPPTRLLAELQAATTEREDMQMQLEAANKQLRSTKQFLEEQAAERENERDEFQRELKHIKEENSKLLQKNQQYIRISKEVDQLEALIRDMTNKIIDLEQENQAKQSDIVTSLEEIAILRDLIGTLESQLETKSSQEIEVMKDLENYKSLAEEKDIKLKDVSRELAILKNDVATKIADDLLSKNNKTDEVNGVEAEKKMVEQMRGEIQSFIKILSEHTTGLESLHEAICSQSCSSPSEDVSIRDHKKCQNKGEEPPLDVSNGRLPVLEVWQLGDGLQRHLRAEDAAVKRIRDLEMQLIQLKDISQELRMERDVLQERMCEQSLKISSLQSRLDQTRHTVEAQSYHNMEGLRRQLDEALAEVQLLRESLDSKDKQLKVFEGTPPTPENSRDFIQRLKRDLDEYKGKARNFQKLLENKQIEHDTALADKNADIEVLRQQLLEREKHLQAVISLQVDEDKEKDINEGKLSARTLSDILSISEFDEPDIMRRMEPSAVSYVSGQFNLHSHNKDNDTGLPDLHNAEQLPLADSNIEYNNSHNENAMSFHKLIEESIIISDKHRTNSIKGAEKALSQNMSMFPNKNASGDKNNTIEPRKLDFSIANVLERDLEKKIYRNPFSLHNLSLNEPLYTSGEIDKIVPPYKSLDDLGIVADYQQKIVPDNVAQLKSEIHILKEELNAKTSKLEVAQVQLSEFPLVKNDMEELRQMLQNSLETMQEDKKYYNKQLDNFALSEKVLKEKLEKAHKEVIEKCDEIKILKEDILRRETVVSEIYKEKKSIEIQLAKLDEKCKLLENKTSENDNLRDKLTELEKLQQMISEKNLQIDNLNENLDKLDDLQKQVMEQKSLNDNLNANLIMKMKEIASIQQENQQLKHDSNQISVENKKLINDVKRTSNKISDLQTTLKIYRDMFTLLEKDLEGVLQKPTVSPRSAAVSPNNEEIVKFEEYKQLLSGLEQQKSPNNSLSESLLESQRQEMLNKIKSKITMLQNELHSKRKELNIKALQIEKAELEVSDLKMQIEYYNKGDNEKNDMLQKLIHERDKLRDNLENLLDRLREENNMDELHEKLKKKTEECRELENKISNLRDALDKNSFNNSNAVEVDGLKLMLSEREDHITHLVTAIQNLQQEKVKLVTILQQDKLSLSSLQAQQDINVIKLLNERLNTESNLQMELDREKAASEKLAKQVVMLKTQLEEMHDNMKYNDQMNTNNGWVQQEKFDRINGKLERQVEITESLASEIKLLSGHLERDKERIIYLQNMLDTEKQYFQRQAIVKDDQNNLVIELQRKNHELHLELVHARETFHLQKNKNNDLEKRLTKLKEYQRKNETVDTYETLMEMEKLLSRNINENIQMSETVRELTHERRDLQSKVRQLENQIKSSTKHSTSMFNLPEGVDQQVSFLHGRYMRVESYRKALIWQKRFLVRVAAAGFILQNWKNSSGPPVQRFKCVAFAIIAVNRMKFLVRRWHTGNRIGSNIHLNKLNAYPTELRNSKSYSHIPSCSHKNEAKTRHSLSNNLGLHAGGPKLGNKAWIGSSNPNISFCQSERFNGNNSHQIHCSVDVLSEQPLSGKCRLSQVVLEENEKTEDHNNRREDESSNCENLNKKLMSEVTSTSSRFNTPREPLDTKLHRALFSPREHDI